MSQFPRCSHSTANCKLAALPRNQPPLVIALPGTTDSKAMTATLQAPQSTAQTHAGDHPPEVRLTAQQLMPLLFDELRNRARFERSRLRAGETLQTTALVHEAYLRLYRSPSWQDELHFMRASALAMRQVLVDHARRKLAAKRGSGQIESLDDLPLEPLGREDSQLVELDEALQKLSLLNPHLTHLIECRYFAGYSEAETARILGVSERTLRRDWVKAKAWLYQALGNDPTGDNAA